MSFLRYFLLALIVLGSTYGDIYLAKGMKQIGEISPSRWHDLLFAPLNPYVAFGIALLMIFYISYLASLSWAAGSLYSRGAKLPDDSFLTTGMEMLCVKAGAGSLGVDGRVLQRRDAKKLPSSD